MPPEVDALLAAPDTRTWTGWRDHALLLLDIQTGLHISELTGLTVSDVHLLGKTSWSGWFGGSAKRTLVLTVHNTGSVAVNDLPVSISLDHNGTEQQTVVSPDVSTIPVGGEVTYSAAVLVFGPANGSYAVTGQVAGVNAPQSFSTSFQTSPKGLLGVGLLVALLLVARIIVGVVRGRRRRGGEDTVIELTSH